MRKKDLVCKYSFAAHMRFAGQEELLQKLRNLCDPPSDRFMTTTSAGKPTA